MILHLIQDMPYKDFSTSTSDLCQVYDQMLMWIDKAPTGSEACIQTSSLLNVLRTGFQNPPTKEIRQAVEQGAVHPLQEKDFAIQPGSYTFFQLLGTPTKDEVVPLLEKTLADILQDGPCCIYLRLLKENDIAVIAQLLLPL